LIVEGFLAFDEEIDGLGVFQMLSDHQVDGSLNELPRVVDLLGGLYVEQAIPERHLERDLLRQLLSHDYYTTL